MPEENFWSLWCKERLTEADTSTIRLGATPSRQTKQCPPPSPYFFTGRMPFLPPNQQHQRQSPEGNIHFHLHNNTKRVIYQQDCPHGSTHALANARRNSCFQKKFLCLFIHYYHLLHGLLTLQSQFNGRRAQQGLIPVRLVSVTGSMRNDGLAKLMYCSKSQ